MDLSKVLGKELLEGRFWTHSKTLVSGCTKISPGCSNCWSEAMQMRFNGGKPFDGTIIEHWDRMSDILPKSGHRKPRVWTYWNDLFHKAVSGEFRDTLLNKIMCSNDIHIICTKRPDVVMSYFTEPIRLLPLSNLIIMVTIEDQERIKERMPYAAKIAELRYNVGLLCEPLLEPLNLCLDIWPVLPKWIICGPENGKGKRQFDGAWAMRLQAQAKAAGVPFFYKAGILNGKRYIETP